MNKWGWGGGWGKVVLLGVKDLLLCVNLNAIKSPNILSCRESWFSVNTWHYTSVFCVQIETLWSCTVFSICLFLMCTWGSQGVSQELDIMFTLSYYLFKTYFFCKHDLFFAVSQQISLLLSFTLHTVCNKYKHHLVAFKEFRLPSQLQSCTYIWLPPAGNPPFQKSHIMNTSCFHFSLMVCLLWDVFNKKKQKKPKPHNPKTCKTSTNFHRMSA